MVSGRCLVGIALASSLCFVTAQKPARVVYGKYYSLDQQGRKDQTINSANLFWPSNTGKGTELLPVVMEIHGGGFFSGEASSSAQKSYFPLEAITSNGFAYVAINYRLVNGVYYYDDPSGKATEEEFINVSSNGNLSLHPTMKMSEYKVRISHMELVTKCAYDAVSALEYLITHADSLGVDMHRLSFVGDSAGTLEIAYLSFVYPHLPDGVGRYTPTAMTILSAQLDYAPQPVTNGCLALWTSELGKDMKLKNVLQKDACTGIVTNSFCTGIRPVTADLALCNKTWNGDAETYCEERFDSLSLGELEATQVWIEDTEQAKGLAKLWYISRNIASSPPGFVIYIHNKHNLTDAQSFIHNPLYAHQYAKFAAAAQVDYVVYYANYYGMPQDPQATYFHTPIDRNYKSNFGFKDLPQVARLERGSMDELAMAHCVASKVHGCRGSQSLEATQSNRLQPVYV